MKNPLLYSGVFHTPKDIEELMHIAEHMTNSSESWRMMVFTMNYCYKMVEAEIEKQKLKPITVKTVTARRIAKSN